MSECCRVALTVNGEPREVEVEARTLLSDLLRDHLGLTGTHVGCEQGACGACTVLWNGWPVRACLALAPQAEGAHIETIEGVAGAGAHRVKRALHELHGLQCGFCTPGIVMSLVAAMRERLPLDLVEGAVLDGHLCRCTGYVNIRAAIRSAWDDLDAQPVDARPRTAG